LGEPKNFLSVSSSKNLSNFPLELISKLFSSLFFLVVRERAKIFNIQTVVGENKEMRVLLLSS